MRKQSLRELQTLVQYVSAVVTAARVYFCLLLLLMLMFTCDQVKRDVHDAKVDAALQLGVDLLS